MTTSIIFFIQYIKDKFTKIKTNIIEPGETEFDYVPLVKPKQKTKRKKNTIKK
jgi:hypothetical protein